MKKFIYSALAATALVSVAGAAQAQASHSIVNPVNQSLTRDVTTTTQMMVNQVRLFPGAPWQNATQTQYNVACAISNSLCRRNPQDVTTTTQVTDATFTITGDAPNNTEDATPTVTNAFTIRGNVTPDCSFYGSTAEGRDINLGTIGVRTGNDEAVSNMFNMRAAATVNVATSAAGCNTNNIVTVEKDNVLGLVNDDAGAYDSAQFQANLPYTVLASFSGVELGAGAGTASDREVDLGEDDLTGNVQSGAWRSNFNMDVRVPAPSKGLVAGDYQGKITVTLAAL